LPLTSSNAELIKQKEHLGGIDLKYPLPSGGNSTKATKLVCIKASLNLGLSNSTI
jgi:hypothetical protein